MRKENRISSKKRKGYRDEKAALIILLIWIFLAVCVPLFGPYSPTITDTINAESQSDTVSGAARPIISSTDVPGS